MSTSTDTPSTPTPKLPKNPARGNQQGQTTLAAKIDRWEGMINNLLPVLDELPQLKPAHAQLRQAVADAKAMRDRLSTMKAAVRGSTSQRKALMMTAEELFSRLSLGLRSAFGPKNKRLVAFAVKPLKTGRPSLVPEILSPVPELTAAPATAGAPQGATVQATVPAKE